MKITFNKSTTLIIGGSSSIGLAICDEFINNEYNVLATYSTKEIFPKMLLQTHVLDLISDQSIKDFVAHLSSKSIIFKNIIFLPSILPGNNLAEYKENDYMNVMQINFLGQAKLVKGLTKLMEDKASILMMSSISARRGSYDPIYAASKGAVLSFVKSMATQIPKGSRINAIAPGLIEDSKMYLDMKKSRQDFHRLASPSGQLIKLEDLAKIIFDLCQPHWRQMNGACIDINGGVYVG